MKLAGKNPVLERLRANPASIRKIYIQQGFSEAALIRQKAQRHGIPVMTILSSKMQKIGHHKNTQGILVDVNNFEYIPFDELLKTAVKKKRTLVFLDGLNDPQNLGAIIRSLSCLGRFSVILPSHGSVNVTEAVLRVASGGDNYLPIAKVSNLNQSISQAKDDGFTIIGTLSDGKKSIYELGCGGL